MPYLAALALIIATAIYLIARLLPRTHTSSTRALEPRRGREPEMRPPEHDQRADEGDTP